MGSLPNRLVEIPPATKKKAPQKAGAAVPPVVEIRSREDLAGAFSIGSAYAANYFEGWTPLPRVLALDGFSLSSGAAWWALTLCLVSMMGRNRKRAGDPLPQEIEINKAEISLLCRTSQHNINLVLAQMSERKLAIVSHLAGARCVVRFIFEPCTIGSTKYPGWSEVAKVPHEEWARGKAESLRDEAEEQDAIADDLEEQRVKAGVVAVVKVPRVLRPGKREKAVAVNCGVKSHRVDLIESDASLDVTYTAVVSSGEFITTVCVPKLAKTKAKTETLESNSSANPLKATTSVMSSGRTCPETAKIPPNAGNGKSPHKGEVYVSDNPRAAELSSLFDPFLLKSCNKSLSGDLTALHAACDAISDTPHDVLVKAAVERAARPLSGPRAVSAICREIHHNWELQKNMPAGKKAVTYEEIQEMVVKEKAALAAARRRK